MMKWTKVFLPVLIIFFVGILSACRGVTDPEDLLPDDNGNGDTDVTTTIWFYNSLGWDSVNVYVWDGDNQIYGEWPGEAAIQDGTTDWWYAAVPMDADETPINIIFNGGGQQTSDIVVDNTTDVYLTVNNSLFSSKADAEASLVSEYEDTTIWFYNSEDWDDLHAYMFGAAGELLGAWPGTAATQDGTTDWWYVEVPVDTDALSITIIFNGIDNQTDDVVINDRDAIYITAVSEVFTSKAAAENFMFDYVPTTTMWFYNSDAWTDVYAYVNGTATELLGAFPGTAATQDGSTAWWSVEVPADAEETPFTITFNDGDQAAADGALIENDTHVFITMAENETFSTREAASAWYDAEVVTEIYFYNSGNWDSVYAYVWDDDDIKYFGEWPGSSASQVGTTDWWVIEVPVNLNDTEFNVIFNNEGSPQTTDIRIDDAAYVYLTLFDAFSSETDAEASLTFTRVYFYNSAEWTDINAYMFGDDIWPVLGEWPGTGATQEGETDWWYIDVPLDPATTPFSIIFNADQGQTDDLLIDNDDLVYITVYNQIFGSKQDAIDAVEALEGETTVSFYNSEGWTEVYAYVHGDAGEALGIWPGALAVQDDTTDWWVIDVPLNAEEAPFNIIFTNDAGDQSGGVLINDDVHVYVTMAAETTYTSRTIAEAWATINPDDVTEVYFYNSGEWTDVYAYTYGDAGEVLGSWPGTQADPATEADWFVIEVPVNLATNDFTIIFNNNDGAQSANILIDDASFVYSTIFEAFSSKVDAVGSLATSEIWFYNSGEWTDVYAYVFGDSGDALGGWPGTVATQDGDTDWWYVEVPLDPDVNPFSIIFNNNDGSQTTGILINDADFVYLTIMQAFSSKADAEASLVSTQVWFYNSDAWSNIHAYVFGDAGEVLGGWPGAVATQDGTTNWWYVEVPLDPAVTTFSIIFNADGNQTLDIVINTADGLYITTDNLVYTSKTAAEDSID